MTEDPPPDPQAVAAAFGLAGPVTGWAPVGGAWSNRVYRLEAGGQAYAVKEMRNPWRLARWEQWLAESWSFELSAIAAGIAAPEPVPSPVTGGCLIRVPREAGQPPGPAARQEAAVRVHRWVDGTPLGPGVAAPQVARWAGQALATLHGLAVRPADRSLFPFPDTASAGGWDELTDAAYRARAPWAALLTAAAPSVGLIAGLAAAAGYRPGEEVFSHGDIDQKNLLATASGLVLCDWDVAVPVMPRRELADVALSMGCWQDFEIAREVVRAYREAGGDDTPIVSADLGQPMMTGLDWVVLNVERALGQRPATRQEIVQAGELIPALLAGLPEQAGVALRIGEILRV
jgi:Ser/Thr protein kinase RdoA (MazF antagonist)